MSLEKQTIIGISFTLASRDSILEHLKKWLRSTKTSGIRQMGKVRESVVIVTPNPEQVVRARSNPGFAKLLNQADIAIPDGIGIILANRILGGHQLPGKIAGIDLMDEIVGITSKERISIGLIGGGNQVAERALECLRKTYQNLIGWAEEGPELVAGSWKLEDRKKDVTSTTIYQLLTTTERKSIKSYVQELSERIRQTNTRIVFVGFGAPKQEYFMKAISFELIAIGHPVILMAVGGSLDEFSGRLPHAPAWVSNLGFKWLWRLILEPWRWKRQIDLIQFIILVINEKLRIFLHG